MHCGQREQALTKMERQVGVNQGLEVRHVCGQGEAVRMHARMQALTQC